MNSEITRNQYDTFDRIKSFGTKYGSRFAPGSRAVGLFADIAAVTTAMEANGVKQLSGTATFHGGTDAKNVAAELIREDMRAIRDTAEAISLAEGLPEFDDQFLMPRSGAVALLLTTARAFHKDATPHKALFVEFELPADFLADLAADIALLEKALDDKGGGLSEQVGGTAELTSQTLKGIAIRQQLLSIVSNKFRHEPGILAEWATATHTVRAARKPAAAAPK